MHLKKVNIFQKSIYYIRKLIDLNKKKKIPKLKHYSIKSILNKIMKQNKIFLIIYL